MTCKNKAHPVEGDRNNSTMNHTKTEEEEDNFYFNLIKSTQVKTRTVDPLVESWNHTTASRGNK